ncbi:hypothetical protein BRAS3843_1460004 [Bradyrhizobium sp. STM 3843]|nr:hypothetical protein BRAS3843_1460004 [Bradyrhizobium sp. STM 3843]
MAAADDGPQLEFVFSNPEAENGGEKSAIKL